MALQSDFALPNPARNDTQVQAGEIALVNFALAPVVKPEIELSKEVVVVGGPRVPLTLGASSAFEGAGTLEVTRGAASIKLYKRTKGHGDGDGDGEPAFASNPVKFASVPAGGIELEVEAVESSELRGVEFQWKLESNSDPVALDPARTAVTAGKVELVAKTAMGAELSSAVKTGEGGVVHLQNHAGDRARVGITPRCEPPELTGQLRILGIKNNIAAYDAVTAGSVVNLPTTLDLGPNMPTYYVEGRRTSDAVADTGLQADWVGEVDDADHVNLTVVETKLHVYGGTPGCSDPATRLTEADKFDPGRRLYVQDADHWWWSRVRVQVTKDPPQTPCTLRIRASGAGDVRLFPEMMRVGTNDVPLDRHVDGETTLGLPYDLPNDAITDAAEGSSYWVEGQISSADAKRELRLDLVDVEQDVDKVAFRVQEPLAEYERINVIDLGGPGSGHQAAVIKFLKSLSAIGYGGQVVLSYPRKKTPIYAGKLGRATELASPQGSYDLYHKDWTATEPAGLNISCRPHGDSIVPAIVQKVGRIVKDKLSLESSPANLEEFWVQYIWPGATPDPHGAVRGIIEGDKNLKGLWGSKSKEGWKAKRYEKRPEELRDWIFSQRGESSLIKPEEVRALAHDGSRTLTVFAAKDVPFPTDLSATLQKVTSDSSPVVMSFQPFLWRWGGGTRMRVWQDGEEKASLGEKSRAVGAKLVYQFSLSAPGGDGAKVGGCTNVVAKNVLQRAMAKDVVLISAYYTDTMSPVKYSDLLKVMVHVARRAALASKVVVALIGDSDKNAHEVVGHGLREDGDVFVRTDATDSGGEVKIELAHVGRTNMMTQFQRYSTMFVAEGANTWQELLTLGTPTISAAPGGETKPWDEQPPTGGDQVLDASKALLAAAKDLSDQDAIGSLVTFLNDARDDHSALSGYFREWSQMLTNPHSDQVVMRVRYLPDLHAGGE